MILPCGAATSQTAPSSVLNTQIQLGDVFATQTLNVETVTDQTAAASGATANSYEAASTGNNIDMRSNQTAGGGVTAYTQVNVGSNSGATTTTTAAAAGNSGFAGVTGATMTGVFTQTTNAVPIASINKIEAAEAQAGDVSASSQALGNSQSLSVSAGTAGLRVNQTNAAQVTSDGGGVYGLVVGKAGFDAATIANNVSYSGDSGSGTALAVSQNNTADLTQAAQFTNYGQVQEAKTTAQATGNNVSAVNSGFVLDATVQQHNQSYVRAQAEGTAAYFGAVSTTASGVGNNALLGDVGGEVLIDNTQVNDGGGIDSIASTTAQDGYDATATATATGNSVTGYACAACEGRMSVANSQTNTSEVGASATTTTTGTVRSATGVATAVGNTATYYVSRPAGQ
ncbi:holdfast anchor protein HfaD [Phenylobacterium aquaticum]|uniref:holdfast anchor protein HfaD n=1 Tax=Phenylobacterium aquaticum TaxID=1763816 RepID=UPI0026EC6434|nr:holdfast anchor protein HfaD [Phenylobacterium aquaticum]